MQTAHMHTCQIEGRMPKNPTNSQISIICNVHISSPAGKRNPLDVPNFDQFYNMQVSENCSLQPVSIDRDAICCW